MVLISWTNITNSFFSELQQHRDAMGTTYIYFDSIDFHVNDDVYKWLSHLLLDALLCVDNQIHIPPEDIEKRGFNHHKTLHACILNAYVENASDSSDATLTIHEFQNWASTSALMGSLNPSEHNNSNDVSISSSAVLSLLISLVPSSDLQLLVTRVSKRIIESHLKTTSQHTMLTYPPNSSTDNSMSCVSWSCVLSLFNNKYDEVFLVKDTKAHFDCTPLIVDGAKERWRSLLLLDAIVCYANPRTSHLGRRSFDQRDVLRQCIITAHYQKTSSTLSTRITNIPHPWKSLIDLRRSFWCNETRKSLAKRSTVVTSLCDAPLLQQLELPAAIRAVADHILYHHPLLNETSAKLSTFCNSVLQMAEHDNLDTSSTLNAATKKRLSHFCDLFIMLAEGAKAQNDDIEEKPVEYLDIMELTHHNNVGESTSNKHVSVSPEDEAVAAAISSHFGSMNENDQSMTRKRRKKIKY